MAHMTQSTESLEKICCWEKSVTYFPFPFSSQAQDPRDIGIEIIVLRLDLRSYPCPSLRKTV